MCVAMQCESGRVGDLSKCETTEEGDESGDCPQEMFYSSLLYTKPGPSGNHERGFSY